MYRRVPARLAARARALRKASRAPGRSGGFDLKRAMPRLNQAGSLVASCWTTWARSFTASLYFSWSIAANPCTYGEVPLSSWAASGRAKSSVTIATTNANAGRLRLMRQIPLPRGYGQADSRRDYRHAVYLCQRALPTQGRRLGAGRWWLVGRGRDESTNPALSVEGPRRAAGADAIPPASPQRPTTNPQRPPPYISMNRSHSSPSAGVATAPLIRNCLVCSPNSCLYPSRCSLQLAPTSSFFPASRTSW